MSFSSLTILKNDELDKLIYEENLQESKQLYEKSKLIKKTMSEITDLLEKSGNQIKHVEKKTEVSKKDIENSKIKIEESQTYSKNTHILKATALLSVVGLCIGGPLGGVICNSIGSSLVGIGIFSGSVIGTLSFGGTTYGILKSKN